MTFKKKITIAVCVILWIIALMVSILITYGCAAKMNSDSRYRTESVNSAEQSVHIPRVQPAN